jgi:4-amino-4-deoxy-L-arabinose transferase-like glycosyltransferase
MKRAGHPLVKAERIRANAPVWVATSVLIALFAIDFHMDVRERDVFSWMDPYQHYEFSLDVVQGRAAFSEFEIPSLFPALVMPFLAVEPSIPASLWVNFAAMLLLLAGLHGLGRELGMKTPAPIVALLVLSSPIMVGLARTLYIEFTLTAMATVVFLLWLRFLRRMDWRSGVAFAPPSF